LLSGYSTLFIYSEFHRIALFFTPAGHVTRPRLSAQTRGIFLRGSSTNAAAASYVMHHHAQLAKAISRLRRRYPHVVVDSQLVHPIAYQGRTKKRSENEKEMTNGAE
jgi:hypothetical protein